MAKKLDDMMGAMGEMPAAGEEGESVPPVPVDNGPSEVSEEELQHAEDMGFDGAQAAALKRFIRSCIDSGEYAEEENEADGQAPSTELGDM